MQLIIKQIFILILICGSLITVGLEADTANNNSGANNDTTSLEAQIRAQKKTLNTVELLYDTLQIANVHNEIGRLFSIIGNIDLATEHYLKALDIYNSINDKNGVSNSLNNLGIVYAKTNQYPKALKYFKSVLQIKKNLLKNYDNNERIIFYIGGSLNNIGLVFDMMGERDSAIGYFQESLKIRESTNNKIGISESLNNLGVTYFGSRNYTKALTFLNRSLEISDSLNDTYGIAEVSLNIARIYFEIENYSMTKEFLIKCENSAQKLGSKEMMMELHKLYAELYQKQKKYALANQHINSYTAIKDSLVSIEMREKIANLQIVHEISQKEEEIKLLTKEKELEIEKSEHKETWLKYLTLLLIIIISSSVVLFYQKKKLSTAYRDIVKRNLEIIEVEQKSKPNNLILSQKYHTSKLDENKRAETIDQLIKLFDIEKIYMHADLTINDLSSKINISRTYLSQIINEEFNESFTNLINRYRIKEAMLMLSNSENNKYSISGIAETTGFKSISSFNNYFKNHSGVTPSVFKKLSQDKDLLAQQ